MEKVKKIYIGADHAGFKVKEKLKNYLDKKKIFYEDMGTCSSASTDYPDYALAVAKRVSKEKNARGILICGTGTGMAIAANKVMGIRAVAAYDSYSARMSRLHNNANILALRGRFFPFARAKKIVSIWLNTSFSEKPRHKRRINKIRRFENESR